MKNLSKKMIIIILTLFMFMGLVSCGSAKNVASDLCNFVNDNLADIQVKANETISQYNDYASSDEMKPDELLKLLQDSIIPTYQECIEQVEQLEPKTEEVKEIQTLYLDASRKQLAALEKIAEGIITQDAVKYEEARDLTTETESAFTRYYSQCKILATDNAVSLSGMENPVGVDQDEE